MKEVTCLLEEAKISEDDNTIESECGICMTVMVEPVKFPCKHVFCAQCAQVFLVQSRECPLCRVEVPKGWTMTVDKELAT